MEHVLRVDNYLDDVSCAVTKGCPDEPADGLVGKISDGKASTDSPEYFNILFLFQCITTVDVCLLTFPHNSKLKRCFSNLASIIFYFLDAEVGVVPKKPKPFVFCIFLPNFRYFPKTAVFCVLYSIF